MGYRQIYNAGSTVRQRKSTGCRQPVTGRVKATLDRLPHTIIAASNTGANSENTRVNWQTLFLWGSVKMVDNMVICLWILFSIERKFAI